jgi:two-component system cell cycle response regulator
MARIRANIRTFVLLQELEESKRELEKMAVTDGLTDIFNHKHVHKLLEDHVEAAKERQHSLSVIMLDIDHFKWVNDAYGHQTGDKVLVKIAAVIKASTRKNDILGRYGGEEFLIILPETDKEQAGKVAEQLRSQIEGLSFTNGLKVTVSGGIAELDGESAMNLVSRADSLLYEAKRNGRNRIQV